MEKLAIIGTGIAGMGCAHLLQGRYDLALFEKNDYVGGHTNTITVEEDGREVRMDTGFMVFNYETYPHLCRLFAEIKAPVKKTDMSFSVNHVPSGLEYCGSGMGGLFAQRKNLFNLRYIRMLMEIARFNREAVRVLDDPELQEYTLGQFVERGGFGPDMLWKYLVPMSSAVWSTPMERMLDFPAATLIRFFRNHGFLGLTTQHQWHTLEGGSRSYRELLIGPFRDRIAVCNPVSKVGRQDGKWVVHTGNTGPRFFDKVVFACHADQALGLLESPTDSARNLLSVFRYQDNLATVHTDEGVMPRNKRVWSSWNYRIEQREGRLVPTTIYWMNRLQQVSDRKNYFVSINAIPGSIREDRLIREIRYEHPLFDVSAVKAQRDLPRLNEQGLGKGGEDPAGLFFCGSYFGYGFHEDAYASAVNLCKLLVNE
ncbi:MAG: FAD-dependent oxidoreductase [Puia sp.]|nr:FAD-dependent oxidoreductase [Puia sp.]